MMKLYNLGLFSALLSSLQEKIFRNFKFEYQAASVLGRMACGTLEDRRVVTDHGALPNFALTALGNISLDSRECRDLILAHGALSPLLRQLNEQLNGDVNVMRLRLGVWPLCSFCYHESQFEQLKLSLPKLQRLIYSRDEAVLGDACQAFSYLLSYTNNKIQTTIDAGVYQRLVDLLRNPSPTVLIQALDTITCIMEADDVKTQCIIDKGALPRLLSLLSDNHEESNSNFTTRDRDKIQFKAARALETIASGSSENRKVLIDHGAVPIFARLLGFPNNDLYQQGGVLALGDIASDSRQCRDLVLENGALILLPHLLKDAHLKMQTSVTWTLGKFRQHKPKPRFEQIKPALAALQDHIYANDEGVLRNVCWFVSLLTDNINDEIQAVLDAGVCKRLVELLMHSSKAVLIPSLRAVRNITAEGEVQAQHVIDHGALPCLLSLLTQNHKNKIKKDACSTIFYITARNRDQTQAVIEAGLISPLLNLLKTAEFDIKLWAALAISKVTYDVTREQMKFLVDGGCIKPLCDLLVHPDSIIVTTCLKGLENILEFGEVEKNQGNTGNDNNLAQMIEEAEGLEKIKNLRAHDDDEIHETATQILTYWLDKEGNDDGEDEDNDDEDDDGNEDDDDEDEDLWEGETPTEGN